MVYFGNLPLNPINCFPKNNLFKIFPYVFPLAGNSEYRLKLKVEEQ